MKFDTQVEQWRIRRGAYGSDAGEMQGAFVIPGPCGRDLRVIASSGDESLGVDWEHVSVSLGNRCPNWQEMDYIKSLFWADEEAVMQLHPPRSQWINNHNYCLHLWRPLKSEIPLPPSIAVGIKDLV